MLFLSSKELGKQLSGVRYKPASEGPCTKWESEAGAPDSRAEHTITSGGGCPYVLSKARGGHSLRIPLLALPTLYLWDEEKVLDSRSLHQAHFINTELILKNKTNKPKSLHSPEVWPIDQWFSKNIFSYLRFQSLQQCPLRTSLLEWSLLSSPAPSSFFPALLSPRQQKQQFPPDSA